MRGRFEIQGDEEVGAVENPLGFTIRPYSLISFINSKRCLVLRIKWIIDREEGGVSKFI